MNRGINNKIFIILLFLSFIFTYYLYASSIGMENKFTGGDKYLTELNSLIEIELAKEEFLLKGKRHYENEEYTDALIDFYTVLAIDDSDKRVGEYIKKSKERLKNQDKKKSGSFIAVIARAGEAYRRNDDKEFLKKRKRFP